ncbi:MAG: hypothetical protein AAGD43_02300 [Pseudomonadota bacterium]
MNDTENTEEEKSFCPSCLFVGVIVGLGYCFGFCPESFADSLPFLVFAGGCVVIGVTGMVVDWFADRSSEAADEGTTEIPLDAPDAEGHVQ